MRTRGWNAEGKSNIDQWVVNHLKKRKWVMAIEIFRESEVSETAVRNALERLVDDGLVSRKQDSRGYPVYRYEPLRRLMLSRPWTPEGLADLGDYVGAAQ